MNELFDSIVQQADVAMSLSIAGIGAILFTWSRMYGVIDSKDLTEFKKPEYLALPFVVFLISILCHYMLVSAITGFNWELVTGHAQKGTAVEDSVSHFNEEYSRPIYFVASAQFLASILGVIGVSVWYLWNVLRRK